MPEFVQINVNVTEEDARMIDRMMVEDAYDNRSAFIRRLIRQEWARRYSRPNPLISVADAMLAGKEIGDGKE
ncbi:MAG: ribbon-helix-helix domain-containing protein [Candidatus Methanomethylicaceae archaeon]